MQSNITTETKRKLITSFLFPKHRPRLNQFPRWLEGFMERPYSRWGTYRVHGRLRSPYRMFEAGWMTDGPTWRRPGTEPGGWSRWSFDFQFSGSVLRLQTVFLFLEFFMTYPVSLVIIGDSVPFSLLRTVYFHRRSESRMSLQDVTQNVIWLQSLPATPVCLMVIVKLLFSISCKWDSRLCLGRKVLINYNCPCCHGNKLQLDYNYISLFLKWIPNHCHGNYPISMVPNYMMLVQKRQRRSTRAGLRPVLTVQLRRAFSFFGWGEFPSVGSYSKVRWCQWVLDVTRV